LRRNLELNEKDSLLKEGPPSNGLIDNDLNINIRSQRFQRLKTPPPTPFLQTYFYMRSLECHLVTHLIKKRVLTRIS